MTLYVSDLDGTLLNNNMKISTTSTLLLNESIKNNLNFTVATARTPATVSEILANVCINLPIIVMNGSAIYDLNKKQYIYYNKLSSGFVNIINNIISGMGVQAFIYTINNNNTLTVYHDKLTNPYQIEFRNARLNKTKYKVFTLSDIPLNCKVLYFTIIESEDKINKLYKKLKYIPNINIVRYIDSCNPKIFYLEIYDISTSKSEAIKHLKKLYKFNKIISFGDNINDIPMFEISDECYAVSNAVENLKRIATDVIKSNKEDSVAYFINNRINL